MESRYFKRDISWLSFNYRVLLEAEDDTLPLYERINFISIYSSNLEEFYKIRVADHKAIATGAAHSDEESVQSAMQLVSEINEEVNRQLEERIRIYEQKILPALRQQHIIFYQSRNVEPFHKEFLRSFFREEIFPYLSPVPVSKDKVISFLRDNRLYLAIRLYPKGDKGTEGQANKGRTPQYFVMKLPYSKVPRFIELPKHGKNYYLMFIEDIIKANIDTIFPGYDVDSSYCIKISRDADILIDESANTSEIIEQVKSKVKKTQDRSRLPFCVRPRHARRFSGLPCRCLPHQPPGTGSGRQTPQYGRPAASAQSEQCRAPHPQASAHEADLPGRAGVHLPVCGEKKTCCCTTRTTLSSTSSISCTKPYTNPPCAKSW